MVLAFAVSRSLTTMLYGVDPHDRVTFVIVPVLVAMTAVASVVPASRAARIDPVRTLTRRID